ncbi:MAG: phosphoribosylformylglycinamidine synthase, partial [Bacteroidales bacterium]|nr:phosphoribosylformylglycinamidine synthase [Bacteroidales bacterium]
FGAGGVSVAIGELADGLDIYLDRVPVKYSGLNSTELAISESQERMAVVIEAKDREEFERYCAGENVEVTYVADVTDTSRLRMYNGGKMVVDLSREFIDSAGAKHFAGAAVSPVEFRDPFRWTGDASADEDVILEDELSDRRQSLQKGLIEMFDSTIGRSTVLMPFGGALQTTPVQVSVQKLPVDGYTDTASVMAWGCDPYLSSWSPYHGSAYAVVDACAKVVASGGDFSGMRFSYQEYFQRMSADRHTWGLPLSALLGALKMQVALGLPSIGGKDSMSGTFEDINVPPTLAAFGITTVDANNVISPELKWEGNKLYLVKHTPQANMMPDTDQLKRNWNYIHERILDGTIVSAYAVGLDSVAGSIAKMSFGNGFGINIKADKETLFGKYYGSIVVESQEPLDFEDAILLGEVTEGEDGMLHINGKKADIFEMMDVADRDFNEIYPSFCESQHKRLVPAGLD